MSWEQDLEQVGVNPDAGARLLLIAAEYMRRGEALPKGLAEYVAGAFEVAAHKATERERVEMLGRELGLVRDRAGRPKKATIEDARWAEMQVVFSDDAPFRQADVERWIQKKCEVKERTAASLVTALKIERGQDAAGLEAWLTAASPEQRDVFDRTGQILNHDDAIAVFSRFHRPPKM